MTLSSLTFASPIPMSSLASSCFQPARSTNNHCASLSVSKSTSFLPSFSCFRPSVPSVLIAPNSVSATTFPPAPSPSHRSSVPTRRRARSTSSTPASPSVRRQVYALFSQAKQAERAGHTHKARHLLQQCLSLNRQDAHSWLALARLEARAPYNEQTVAGLHVTSNDTTSTAPPIADVPLTPDSSLSKSPSSSRARASRSIVARRTFEEGLSHCPENLHLLQAWAVHEHRTGDCQRARDLFEQALRIDPGNPYVSHAWGLLEQRSGNIQRARNLYARSVAQKPNAEICVAWGVLEGRDGRIDTARRIFKQAVVSAKPLDNIATLSNVYREWAAVEERVGDLSRARDLLSKAIAAHPTHCTAYVALAKLEARRGCTTRAIELVRAAAEVSPEPPATVFVAWGHIELASCRRLDEARTVFERGIRLHPRDSALLQSLGILEEKCGNVAEARSYFRESVSVKPHAPSFVAWAMLEQRQNQFDEARRLFDEAISVDALHGAAYHAYGMMEARIGDQFAARRVFQRGVKCAASASLYHGFALFELRYGRDVQRARELLRRGVDQSREDTSFVWHSWGMMELSERSVLDARTIFAEALKRYPCSSQLLLGAAMAEAMGRYRSRSIELRARELFKQAVAANPTHAQAWQTWGVFELRGGRKDVAVALFRRGLRLCPSHAALWQAWGVLETGREAYGRARQLFRRGVDACPNDVHLLQAWACMEVRANNVERARELLDAALGIDRSQGAVWNAYGLLEARHGTLAKAKQIFSTGTRRAEKHAPLFRAFGETQVRAGDFDHARTLYEQGLSIDPYHAPLYHALAKLHAMMGNLDALADLKRQAETYFGSELDATRAIHSGEGRDDSSGIEFDEDDVVKCGYEAKVTPMEIALNSGDTLSC